MSDRPVTLHRRGQRNWFGKESTSCRRRSCTDRKGCGQQQVEQLEVADSIHAERTADLGYMQGKAQLQTIKDHLEFGNAKAPHSTEIKKCERNGILKIGWIQCLFRCVNTGEPGKCQVLWNLSKLSPLNNIKHRLQRGSLYCRLQNGALSVAYALHPNRQTDFAVVAYKNVTFRQRAGCSVPMQLCFFINNQPVLSFETLFLEC